MSLSMTLGLLLSTDRKLVQHAMLSIKTKTNKVDIGGILNISEPRHEISNNFDILTSVARTSLCSILLSLETPNSVQSVA